jgi:25S rRNA (adenine2142-N1)-methyltransferase
MARKKSGIGSLLSGRPPLSKKRIGALSSKATRSIIRSHHGLLKARSLALKANDHDRVATIDCDIDKLGGLDRYQEASKIGQLKARGGDTSRILKAWLEESSISRTPNQKCGQETIRVLEIGCLSPHNAISRLSTVDIVRMDLKSTHPSILEQDFMQFSLPNSESDKFDIISLSLVLNFVPDHNQRGEMLLRTTKFLKIKVKEDECRGAEESPLPALFLVLPLRCVTNSRYLTRDHLRTIMESIGYRLRESKSSSKIFYSLWQYTGVVLTSRINFKKREIVAGRGRNNFCVSVNTNNHDRDVL